MTTEIDESGKVVTNQRTLLVVLCAVAACAAAWADLKGDIKSHEKQLVALQATSTADHDTITKINAGVGLLLDQKHQKDNGQWDNR